LTRKKKKKTFFFFEWQERKLFDLLFLQNFNAHLKLKKGNLFQPGFVFIWFDIVKNAVLLSNPNDTILKKK
jgi:hypothetical protein